MWEYYGPVGVVPRMDYLIHTINDGSFRLPGTSFNVYLDGDVLTAEKPGSKSVIYWPVSQLFSWETVDSVEPEVTETRRDLPA